ncbi:Ger(x)C family spore germination protein [Rummeliibacillus stabekisii]|uniref:Ger(x)C family spore germination protein n=1 Tax=Rummeliibacillus stabekisii TaxID=241244 RepID=UPI00203C71F7|nr:Ger(x)C family spore germination protein [Rummeliibacillus stabekisii]MCM3316660.1 Ger(x)C family spore germination protein [Rummeliibacillus stabekisii]
MRKVTVFLLISTFLLSGCWDQRLYKELSVISVIGIEGHIGDIKSYFAYPSSNSDPTKYIVLEGTGKTLRETRIDANKKTEQTMDNAELTTLLVNEESAQKDLYALLDVYYRSAQSPMNAKVVITKGSPKKFLEIKDTSSKEIGEYYYDLITAFEAATIYPKTDLEIAANLMFSEGRDLGLPYLIISGDHGLPEGEGMALFDGKKFTGEHLNLRESIFATLLGDRKAHFVELAYFWNKNDKKVQVAFNIVNFKKKKKVMQDGENINVQYNIDMPILITEYPPNQLDRKNERKHLENFIKERVEKDITSMFKKCQEASSDVLGIGEDIRAYHPQLWKEGKWKEIYKNIKIEVKLNVKIIRSGSIR